VPVVAASEKLEDHLIIPPLNGAHSIRLVTPRLRKKVTSSDFGPNVCLFHEFLGRLIHVSCIYLFVKFNLLADFI
jgi:hypothetical protein